MDETLEQMLERSKKALDQVELFLADYKGSCDDCVFRQKARISDQCRHPVVLAASMLEDQDRRTLNTECNYQRKSGQDGIWGQRFCGPNGFLFERAVPSEPEPTLWKRFKRFFSFQKG